MGSSRRWCWDSAAPNPVGERMQFDLSTAIPGWYRADVFGTSGRLVRTLFDDELGEEVRTLEGWSRYEDQLAWHHASPERASSVK